MPHAWEDNPEFKLVADGEEFINDKAFSIHLVGTENSVSDVLLVVDDYESGSYEGIFDVFGTVIIYLRYSEESWRKAFSGAIKNVSPMLSLQGEILQVAAQGEGRALIKTHCNTSYGVESLNPTKETPKEIWDDLIDNFVNKSYGGAATGWNISKTKIANITSPVITHVPSPYESCFDMICKICEIRTAYRSGAASVHWFMDPDKQLFINTIGAHENHASGWPTFWKGTRAASTIAVKEDQILYKFQKRIAHFANKVLLIAKWRKPGYDSWAEGRAAEWGIKIESGDGWVTDNDEDKVVGNYSLELKAYNGRTNMFWPKTEDAGWDFSKVGSKNDPPFINFYGMRNLLIVQLALHTDWDNYFYTFLLPHMSDPNKWYFLSFPIGPFWKNYVVGGTEFWWTKEGDPSWENINFIKFYIHPNPLETKKLLVDDFHFSGNCLVREAYNSTSISSSRHEHQKVVLMKTAVDDTLNALNDSGLAARLAYAALLRRETEPLVGTIQIPFAPTILPGQLIHVHSAQKANGDYRIDRDFRIKQYIHDINVNLCSTTLNLTSDLKNTFAYGPPTRASLMAEYVGALGHKEAKHLKGSAMDILTPRLSKDYPS